MSMKSIANVKCVFSLYEFSSKKFLIRSLKLCITYFMKTKAVSYRLVCSSRFSVKLCGIRGGASSTSSKKKREVPL